MNLDFLPENILSALQNLNLINLSEIRLREGQPVIIEYNGEYNYLYVGGITSKSSSAIICNDTAGTLYRAMGGCVYAFTEQLKNGFITVNGGIRIGVAGEYVTENGCIKTIKNVTSLNIRIAHNVCNCSFDIFNCLLKSRLHSILLYSVPGYGKTTMLRDMAIQVSKNYKINILVIDIRNEISGGTKGYNLGENVDVILSCDKQVSIKSAIRAMKPQLIITDELYGENDIESMRYAADCGICTFASTHICKHEILKEMPFEYFVHLTGIKSKCEIYDKNFNIVCNSLSYGVCRCSSFG